MAERTILASFYTDDEAKQAAKQIQQLGVEVVEVDELHAYPPIQPERDAYLLHGRIPSIAWATLNTVPESRDAGVLLGTDPSAYSMSDGDGNVTGRNYLLTVVCPEKQVEQAVQIIKDCNGYT